MLLFTASLSYMYMLYVPSACVCESMAVVAYSSRLFIAH